MNIVNKIGKMPLKEFCWYCDIDYFKVRRKIYNEGYEPIEAVRYVCAERKGKVGRPAKYEMKGIPIRHLLNINEYNRFLGHIKKGFSIKKSFELAQTPYSGIWA